jgi:hypothetical protein
MGRSVACYSAAVHRDRRGNGTRPTGWPRKGLATLPRPWNPAEENAMRRIDLLGLSGVAMWVAGVTLAFPTSAARMDGVYLLGGFLLLVSGFACVIAWLLLRWFQSQAPRGNRG